MFGNVINSIVLVGIPHFETFFCTSSVKRSLSHSSILVLFLRFKGSPSITGCMLFSQAWMASPFSNTLHLESDKLGFKEHLAFNEQRKIRFFTFFVSLKIPCIKRTYLRPVLAFNELQLLANILKNAFLLKNYVAEKVPIRLLRNA